MRRNVTCSVWMEIASWHVNSLSPSLSPGGRPMLMALIGTWLPALLRSHGLID